MKVIEPAYEILYPISEGGVWELKHLELAARNCYKSEDYISSDLESAKKLEKFLIKQGHEAMLEHMSLTVRFICDRAFSHELVRHRLASFAQESQRYCNYSREDKFGVNVTFIRPSTLDIQSEAYKVWEEACKSAEASYFKLLDIGLQPQEARSVLPNSTKTDIIVTANYREWRHILKLRTSERAHPDMRYLMTALLNDLKRRIPVIFDDICSQ